MISQEEEGERSQKSGRGINLTPLPPFPGKEEVSSPTPDPHPRYFLILHPSSFILTIAGWLLAIIAISSLLILRPVLEIPLLPGTGESRLTSPNEFVKIERRGFSNANSLAQGEIGRIRVRACSYREISLEISAKGGPATLSLNGQSLGTIPASPELKTYRFNFTPLRLPPDDVAYMTLSIEAESTLEITAARLDYANQWQPFLENNIPALFSLICLVLLLPAWLLAYRWRIFVVLALGLMIGLAGAAGWVVGQVLEVGTSGELNPIIFWWLLSAGLYLIIFAGGCLFAGIPLELVLGAKKSQETTNTLGTGHRDTTTNKIPLNLWSLFSRLWQRWVAPRPILMAILTLTAVNFGLMVMFYGIIAIQNGGWDNLGRFWDGPEYLVNAKTLYDPYDPILQIPFFSTKSEIYWTAHFPGYSLLIRLFSPLFGYVPALFVINFVATVIFGVALYRLLRDFGYSRQPLWVAILAMFLPLRWLIYHSVGASEALTLMFLVLAVYAFKQERWWLAGLWGAGVVVTRPNGFFLGIGFGLFLLWELWRTRTQPITPLQLIKNLNWRAVWGLLPIPLALIAVFGLFGWRYGDFWAYLHVPESVTHIYPLPLLSMDVSSLRSEGNFYYYILQAAGLVLVWRRKQYDIFWIGLVFFLPTIFLLHDDVIRYALPAFPFVLAIPFAPLLETKYARWFAPLAVLAVLIYSWSQLSTNLIDLDSWRQMQNFLK